MVQLSDDETLSQKNSCRAVQVPLFDFLRSSNVDRKKDLIQK
jgi:hypothetical protein